MQFAVLGALQVTADDGEPVAVASRNLRILLATLLCHANAPVSTAELCDALWGSQAPRTARKTLQVYVHQLRKLLGDGRIVSHPHGYAITVTDGELDVDTFRALASESDRAKLIRAEQLWRGEALADLSDVLTLAAPAADLTEQRLTAWMRRVDLDIAAQQHESVVPELLDGVRVRPLDERLRGRLMVALHRSGRRADALRTYQECREKLAEELGVEPSDSLRQIQLTVLRGEAVTEAEAEDSTVPAQLPPPVRGFVGRVGHLARLDAFLNQSTVDGGTVVISAIAGMGGVGKTALAVHWAHRVRRRFPDGQLYANLNGYSSAAPTSPTQVAAQFLRALGVAPETIPTDRDAAASLLRSTLTGRQVLLLLDNAASVDQVRPLLPSSSGCLALVTSRGRMDGLVARDGATRIDLSQLSLSESLALLDELLPSRVAKEPVPAVELAVACGYLPLALRVVAAHLIRSPRMKLSEMVKELEYDRLTTLDVADDPQTSVQVVLSHSYRSLPADAQRLFRLIGAGPCPDFTVRSCEVLTGWGADDAKVALHHLIQTGLLDERLPGRYQPHDLTRDFGRLLAEGCPESEAAQRHAGWVLAATDAASRTVYPIITRVPYAYDRTYDEMFASPKDALLWLDAEWRNITALARKNGSWVLADSLRGYAYLRGVLNELEIVAEAAIETATSENSEIGQAACQLIIGTAHRYRNDAARAIDHFTQAAQHAAQAQWEEGEAGAHANLSEALYRLSRTDEALGHAQQALAVNTRIGNVRGVAGNHVTIGNIFRQTGRLRDAAHHDDEAIRLSRELGALYTEMSTHFNRASTLRHMGDFPGAIEHLHRARAIHQELGIGDQTLICIGLAEVYLDEGRADLAAAELQIGEDTTDDMTDNTFQHELVVSVAVLMRARGRTDRAYHLLDKQLRDVELQPVQRLHTQLHAAELLMDLDRAAEASRLSAETLGHLDNPACAAAAPAICVTGARLALLEGRHDDAAALARQAIERATSTDQRPALARALLMLGKVLGPEHTAAELIQAHRLCVEIGLAPELEQVDKLLAQLA